MFWGKSFIWDGIPSETYNLGIVNFDTGKINSPAGSDIEIFTKSVYRKPKTYLFGVSQTPVLQFSLTIGSPDYIDGTTRNLIEQYLFGHTTFKILQIFESDLQDIYFNCLITKGVGSYVGNLNIGYECDIVCDSPWAYEFPKTITKTYANDIITDEDYTYYNTSANNDYTYALVDFTLNNIGDSFTLTNESDNDRQYIFTGLSNGENIYTDNDRQILTSDTGLRRMTNFNKHWFRLVPGANNLNINGGLSEFILTVQNARKVGG